MAILMFPVLAITGLKPIGFGFGTRGTVRSRYVSGLFPLKYIDAKRSPIRISPPKHAEEVGSILFWSERARTFNPPALIS